MITKRKGKGDLSNTEAAVILKTTAGRTMLRSSIILALALAVSAKTGFDAGWTDVDGYVFPCLSSGCAAPANQVEAVINKLKSTGAKVNYVWLDIEIYHWPADHTHNRNFITAMVNEIESIVGLDWKPYPHLPLWWANYNGEQGFERYQEFGGWAKPTIHQYKGTTAGPCSVSMDLNYKA
ncbi:hypothetical protein WR25_02903 [Diploscapter pachys]|uniref:GH18 domain-containing protein n=1 Tax=Diploscapter pachys TaxID=2018661 RepID=A0A2A2KPG5_9BILA|nr:hypothetical protein WR25_02903 [Diploscapter pachys]